MMTRCFFMATLVMLTVAVSGLLSACGGGGGNVGDTIKIGSLQSITGPTNTFGNSCDRGIRLAAEEKNKAGGVLGKQIEIITADTESDASKAKSAVLKLLDQDQVVAVLGEVASSRTMAAAPFCQNKRIPMLTPASTNPQVTKYGDFIFRACFVDDQQGAWIAQFAIANKMGTAAMLIDQQQDYSKGLARAIQTEYANDGGKVLRTENYRTGDTDFSVPLTAIKQVNPSIVFVPGYYSEIPAIVTKARELGITVPFIGGDGWESDKLIERGGKALEGCFFTTHSDSNDPDPRVKEFVALYLKKYGKVPDAMAVLGFDAANIMFKAIESAGATDGIKIRGALAKTRDFPGVSGDITINAERNAEKPGVVIEIKDGQMKMKQRVGEKNAAAPATAP
jgi:branched-chain amino acid transport system substrate-binding protein